MKRNYYTVSSLYLLFSKTRLAWSSIERFKN